MEYAKRSVLVTGAGSGIGREVALRFAAQGAAVSAVDLNVAAAHQTVDTITQAGGAAMAVGADISKSGECTAAVETTVDRLGGLDVLVNCAGIAKLVELAHTEDDDWHRLIEILLSGTFYLNRAAVRVMKDHQDARIINIASVAGVKALQGRGAYGAAKAGVVQLTRTLALEVGVRGITVNAVAPGPIATAMSEKAHGADAHQSWLDLLAIKRFGRPEEIAAAVTFLASTEAAFITGQVLAVDGGFTAGAFIHR